MKKLFLIIFLFSTAKNSFGGCQADSIIIGNSAFAFDLYKQINKKGKNIFLSPYSISTALAMTYTGAKGQTEKEMQAVMHLGANTPSFHTKYGALIKKIQALNGTDVQVNVANRLFGEKTFDFLPSFLSEVAEYYQAPLEKMDYKYGYTTAHDPINKWVETQTKDRIKNLIKPGMITRETRLILVNAIYFYGDWAKQFDSTHTTDADFFIDPKQRETVKMMTQQDHFEYMENNDMQAIRLPYKGSTMSMEIFLPKKKEGLEALEEKLNAKLLTQWESALTYTKVKLFLPKFKMTEDLMLKEYLEKMGMTLPFSNGADFSKMSEQEALKIDKVIHKAFIEVSEKGTEAAAATAVIMTRTTSIGAPEPPTIIFRADHPFFFIIRDNITGTILFMGRVNKPSI